MKWNMSEERKDLVASLVIMWFIDLFCLLFCAAMYIYAYINNMGENSYRDGMIIMMGLSVINLFYVIWEFHIYKKAKKEKEAINQREIGIGQQLWIIMDGENRKE